VSRRIRNRRHLAPQINPAEVIFECVGNRYFLYLLVRNPYPYGYDYKPVVSDDPTRLQVCGTSNPGAYTAEFSVASRETLMDSKWSFLKNHEVDAFLFARRQIAYLKRREITTKQVLALYK